MNSMSTMPFGRYRGQLLSLLSHEYLQWLRTLDLREPLKTAIAEEWRARRNLAKPDRITARALIDAGYRQLAKSAHPDLGGTTAAMQPVNNTVEWLRRQVGVLT